MIYKRPNLDRDLQALEKFLNGATLYDLAAESGVHTDNIRHMVCLAAKELQKFRTSHNSSLGLRTEQRACGSVTRILEEKDVWLEILSDLKLRLQGGVQITPDSTIAELGLPPRVRTGLLEEEIYHVKDLVEAIKLHGKNFRMTGVRAAGWNYIIAALDNNNIAY